MGALGRDAVKWQARSKARLPLGQHGDELSFGEPGFTLVETVAFAIHLQNVHMVRQPIEQRSGQAFCAEGFRPLFERQVAGDEC